MREHILQNDLDEADFPILSSEPKLSPELVWVWSAFHEVSSGRQRGYGSLQPLTLSDFLEYCYHSGINGEDKEDLIALLRFMDGVFMKYVDAQSNKGTRK
jgi:hypothetical protein